MAWVIICLVLSMLILALATVFSSMASVAAQKGNTVDAHKYSTWAAVTCGLSILLLLIVLFLYLSSGRIIATVHQYTAPAPVAIVA